MSEQNQAVIPTVKELPEAMEKSLESKEKLSESIVQKIPQMISSVGTILLSEEEKEILFAPVNEEAIEIRPDGIIYLPWVEYAKRLSRAFGFEWALLPDGKPLMVNNKVMWPFFLIVRGQLAAYSIGEQSYFPTSATMSYSDAAEGAKSNALMRCCKAKGISLELWTPEFVRNWQKKYAECVNEGMPPKLKWRKKQKEPKN
uniref:Uncharacterized protein n=1 Tax=viral metagenome TaxID=1070528 RepID=A0A6H1ZHH3_9ZZZZ